MFAQYTYANEKAPLDMWSRRAGISSREGLKMSDHTYAKRGTDVYTKIDARTVVVPDGSEPLGACWKWNGAHDGWGYPMVSYPRSNGGKSTMGCVTRLVLERKTGQKLLPSQIAQHKCDNPGCVRPDHLVVGTHKTNAADRDAKGRAGNLRGEAHGSSKLSDDQVDAIRSATGKQYEIAARFGVSQGHVSEIKSGKQRAKPMSGDI